jgi:hypothetical protein
MGRLACVLALVLFAPQLADAQSFAPRDESPADYPAAAGRDQTFYACTPCHGFRIVAQQGQSRAQWDDTIALMTQRFSMPKLEGNDRETVLDYLAAAFPPRRAPGGWQNPFQKQ